MYNELVTLLRTKYDKAPLVMAASDVIEELARRDARWEAVVKAALDYIPCWVSAADGLPEDREDVLCWLLNIYGEPYAAVGCYDARFKIWDVDSEYAEPGSVTHWMPLPVKPED